MTYPDILVVFEASGRRLWGLNSRLGTRPHEENT
jgi:hypothetical protein